LDQATIVGLSSLRSAPTSTADGCRYFFYSTPHREADPCLLPCRSLLAHGSVNLSQGCQAGAPLRIISVSHAVAPDLAHLDSHALLSGPGECPRRIFRCLSTDHASACRPSPFTRQTGRCPSTRFRSSPNSTASRRTFRCRLRKCPPARPSPSSRPSPSQLRC
jgi:hypothetical protein